MLIHANSYHPRPSPHEAPVKIEVELFPDGAEEVDRTKKIPLWPFRVEVTFIDGGTRGINGSVEATDEEDAKLRIQSKAIAFLCELLAEYVKRQHAIGGNTR